MTAVVLPPLDCREQALSRGERLANATMVVLLHAMLGYAMLYVSVKNDLIQLPPSISVRLLPMIEEKPEPARPLLPPPKPQVRKQPVAQPQPVLAVASPTATSSFAVAPQPPAPPPQPVVAPPAPAPVAVVAARFDADYLHNPKPVYPALSRRMNEEGKVLLKVRVSAQGTALDVAISKSSGFPRLDAAAVDAVTRWRFVPARRGDEAVDSSVIVPITFAFE
ncbi:energy transducer TonB [Ferribacterium limneticum]|uniref:energy transducer TonB n=1 Tax=Ferribacterium limneticum TaxID=76259 RepID=UPI001CF9FBDC|nr:energy transducer TonB [Ferribacterium limneticum]